MAEGASQGGREAGAGTRLAAELAELSLRIGLVTRALVALSGKGTSRRTRPAEAKRAWSRRRAALAEGDWFRSAARGARMLRRGVALGTSSPTPWGAGPAAPVEAHLRARRARVRRGLLGAHLHATASLGGADAGRRWPCCDPRAPDGADRALPNAVNFARVFRAPMFFSARRWARRAGEPGEAGAAARGVAGVPSVAVDGADPSPCTPLADAHARARAGRPGLSSGAPDVTTGRPPPRTPLRAGARRRVGGRGGALNARLRPGWPLRATRPGVAPPAPTEPVARPRHRRPLLAAQRRASPPTPAPPPGDLAGGARDDADELR